MKILHVAAYYHPFKGGVETYIQKLSEAMVKQGHEVTVFCANIPKGKSKEVINGVTVRRFPCLFRVSYLPILPTIKLALILSDTDIYHFHIAPPILPEIGLLLAKLKKKRAILTYHNDVIAQGRLGVVASVYNKTLLKLLLNGVDKIIVHTEKYRKSSPYLSPYEKKTEIIPSGVDIEHFSIKDKETAKHWLDIQNQTILFVGSLNIKHRYKGVDLLIKAMPAIVQKVPDARLIIIGKGELKKEYEALVEQLGLTEYVRFEGFVEDKLLASYYKAADVLTMPSINEQEGWGLAPIEALACGTPVVVSDRAGVSEVIDASVGAIARAGDVNDLASKIRQVLIARYDPKKLHAFAKKFSWDNIAKDTLKLYKESIKK